MPNKQNFNRKNKKFNGKNRSKSFTSKKVGGEFYPPTNDKHQRNSIFLFSVTTLFVFLFVVTFWVVKEDQEKSNGQIEIKSYTFLTFLKILKDCAWRIIHYPSFSQMAALEYEDNRLTEFSEVRITHKNVQSTKTNEGNYFKHDYSNIKHNTGNTENTKNNKNFESYKLDLHDFNKEVCYSEISY